MRSVVQALLKYNASGQKKNLPKFIHQATVSREVVVRHIADMKQRGHRGYLHADMKKVEGKANTTLPENGVPEEILRDLMFDSHLDKMVIQKQATTVHEPTANLKKVGDLISVTVPNAVTMERSSCDIVDSDSMLCNALEQLESKVHATENCISNKKESFCCCAF